MKNIIVPTDFSEQATQALKFAVEIAQKSGGKVKLVHVVDLPIISEPLLSNNIYVNDSFVKDAIANAEGKFEKLISKFKGSNVGFKTSVEYGNASMAILKLIEVSKADLVVMGTKGATGMKEIFVGSNTEKIVRGARVPVISIPASNKVSAIKSIVFPNSLREENEALTVKVKALQDFFKAKLHIVYVNTPAMFKRDHETVGRLHTYAKRYMLKDYEIHVYNDVNEQDGTINFTEDIGGDMIAMGTHGKRGIAHLVSGSIAEDVVNHVGCPIWTYRTK